MSEREEMRIKSILMKWISSRVKFFDDPEQNFAHLHDLVEELFQLTMTINTKK